jgi:hypothetical protein
MLTKVRITFACRDLLSADVAHGIAAVADHLVAAAGFDEAEETSRTSAFDGSCGGGFDGGTERCLLGFEAGVWVAPEGVAAHAGY